VRRDVFVYLSGPITAVGAYSVADNVAAGVRVFRECLARGVPAFSPHALEGALGADTSPLGVVPYDDWIAYDLTVIDRCTHVLMLPRWETSVCATTEREYAIARGVPIIHSIDELPEAPRA